MLYMDIYSLYINTVRYFPFQEPVFNFWGNNTPIDNAQNSGHLWKDVDGDQKEHKETSQMLCILFFNLMHLYVCIYFIKFHRALNL